MAQRHQHRGHLRALQAGYLGHHQRIALGQAALDDQRIGHWTGMQLAHRHRTAAADALVTDIGHAFNSHSSCCSSSDRGQVRGQPGLALVQSMPGRFQAKLGGDACQQRVVVLVALQQLAQRYAELAEQAQPQVALGGHPQAVAALAEVTNTAR